MTHIARSSGMVLFAVLICAINGIGADLVVDASRTEGMIRPLHGVNLGPICYRGTVDLTAYHRQIGVPYTRLHDVVWVNADAVDISTIFRDFRNDPKQPENYDFTCTDDYIAGVINTGSKVVYRLGESIEHTPRKYRVHPPADPEKWAQICLGIIRHYNEGWAAGFRRDICYWEIWNEPDVRPGMWTGNDEQFFRLFEVTAKAIKKEFPGVKVGGPAMGGTGHFVDGQFRATTFVTNFLSYCRSHEVPIDFFSWHRYTANPWDLPQRALAMRLVLDQYGYSKTESHLNEWNYLPREDWKPMLKEGQGKLREQWYEEMGGPAGAAFAACGLLLLQDVPLDVANYYTGEIQGFGLFNIHGVPKKSFHAFRAFKELADRPVRLATKGAEPGKLAVCAGTDDGRKEIRVLVACFSGNESSLRFQFQKVPWDGETQCEAAMVDAAHDLDTIQKSTLPSNAVQVEVPVKVPCVVLLRLSKARVP